MGFWIGLCGFAFFFFSDYNDWHMGLRSLRVCFPIGTLLLAAGTVWETISGTPPLEGWLQGALLFLGGIFFVLLVYTLFFSLPVKASYNAPGQKRRVCTQGVYALCRHPGVLWFVGLYLCLWAGGGLPLWEAAVFSATNILLVLFEDVCVFPALLMGYESYKHFTPFLLPNRRSIRLCWNMIRR